MKGVGRSRPRSFAVACLALLVLGAGCVSSGDHAALTNLEPGATEPASSVIVEPEPGVKVAENRGVVRGSVLNDAGFGLANSRVSILQTDQFVNTAKDGHFLLQNVTPGEHTVRVEATGFQVAENDTIVKAGGITNLTIQLVPLEDTGAGYRPHTHDYWGANTEITILDDDQDFLHPTSTNGGAQGSGAAYQATAMVVWPNNNASDTSHDFLVKIPSEVEPPALIYPGTREVDVTITWTQQASTATKVLLKYSSAAHIGDGKVTPLDRRASGSTWKIAVGPDDADAGHQRFTLWRFFVNVYQDPQSDPTNYRPGLILGNFHVKIVVIKGQLLPEKAHRDFWGANTQLLLLDHDRQVDCNSAYRIYERQEHPCLALLYGKIVPPGTQKLLVEMRWTYANTGNSPVPDDFSIVYRSAAQNPWTTKTKDYQVAATQGTTAQLRTAEIVLKPGEADAFYQTGSLWRFTYAVKGHEKDDYDYAVQQPKLTFHVVAVRDPSFNGGTA